MSDRKLALCVGVNRYGAGLDLYGCVNDAGDWANVLDGRGYAVQVLVDEQATRQAILSGIAALVEQADWQDQIVVSFSGHGTWVPDLSGDEPDRRDEALCPVDFRNGLIVDDDLNDLFAQRARGVRIVLISDSCHSGSVSRFAEPLSGDRGRVRFLPPEHVLPPEQVERALSIPRAAAGRPRHSALLMSGCADWEYSYDAVFGGRPNGAFTYVAVEALSSLPDGATYRDWHAAIRQYLPSVDLPQTPALLGTTAMKRWPVL